MQRRVGRGGKEQREGESGAEGKERQSREEKSRGKGKTKRREDKSPDPSNWIVESFVSNSLPGLSRFCIKLI